MSERRIKVSAVKIYNYIERDHLKGREQYINTELIEAISFGEDMNCDWILALAGTGDGAYCYTFETEEEGRANLDRIITEMRGLK